MKEAFPTRFVAMMVLAALIALGGQAGSLCRLENSAPGRDVALNRVGDDSPVEKSDDPTDLGQRCVGSAEAYRTDLVVRTRRQVITRRRQHSDGHVDPIDVGRRDGLERGRLRRYTHYVEQTN